MQSGGIIPSLSVTWVQIGLIPRRSFLPIPNVGRSGTLESVWMTPSYHGSISVTERERRTLTTKAHRAPTAKFKIKWNGKETNDQAVSH
jgi:hypothetical protein